MRQCLLVPIPGACRARLPGKISIFVQPDRVGFMRSSWADCVWLVGHA